LKFLRSHSVNKHALLLSMISLAEDWRMNVFVAGPNKTWVVGLRVFASTTLAAGVRRTIVVPVRIYLTEFYGRWSHKTCGLS